MASLEEQAKDAQQVIRQIELDTKKEASKKAQSIISLAVQRLSGEYVNDSTISVVSLPNEEMKGRIIGRGAEISERLNKVLVSTLSSMTPQKRSSSLASIQSDAKLQKSHLRD